MNYGVLRQPPKKGGISIIYASLADRMDTPAYARSWESDLDIQWDPAKWFQAFSRSSKDILNMALIEANIKVFTKWYYVPARLSRIFPDSSPLCYRGCGHIGTMHHIWWTCPRIRSYWNKFLHILRRVSGIEVPQDPTYILLNCKIHNTPKNTQQLIFIMCLGAKVTLAKAWKTPSVSISATKRKISWITSQEQIVAKLRDTVPRFEGIWEPWARYVGVSLYPGHLLT